jgi:hypothetical protein
VVPAVGSAVVPAVGSAVVPAVGSAVVPAVGSAVVPAGAPGVTAGTAESPPPVIEVSTRSLSTITFLYALPPTGS